MLTLFAGDAFLAARAAQAAAGELAKRFGAGTKAQEVRAYMAQAALFDLPLLIHLPALELRAGEREGFLAALAASPLEVFCSDGELTPKEQQALLAMAPLRYLPTPKGAELVRWVAKELRAGGISADALVPQRLIELLGPDLGTIAQEIQRLTALEGPLSAARLLALVGVGARGQLEAFSLIDPLMGGQLSLALERGEGLLAQGEPPLRLLSALQWHYDLLLRVHLLASALPDAGALAKRLGAHPFPVRRALSIARRLSLEQIGHALVRLALTERELKAGAKPEAALLAALLDLAGLALPHRTG